MATTKIAIAGFTGKMARLITNSLLKSHPNVDIHGICRNIEKVDTTIKNNPRVKLFQAASTDVAALRAGLKSTSVCICCYLGENTLMIDGQKTLIDACILEKVPRYIASDWSFDFRKLELGDHPAKDPMKIVTSYLEEREAAGEIKAVHVLNGAFTQVMFAPFLGYVSADEGKFSYYGTGDEKFDMTTYETAAEYTAEIAVDASAVGFINVLGDRKSIKELAGLYKKRYGVEPIIECKGTREDLKRRMESAFKAEPTNPFAWMGMYYQYWMTAPGIGLDNVENDRYPSVVPVTAEKFLEKYDKDSLGKSAQF